MRTPPLCIPLTALIAACGGDGPCDDYRFSGGLYAYCVRTLTVNLPSMQQAEQGCAVLSGEAESDCRTAWMDVHLGRTGDSRAALLAFCRSDDCRMLVLDLQASTDVRQQLEDCQQVGRYTLDCMGHARQRWLLGHPGAAELQRVAQNPGPYGAELSEWIGEAIRCGTPWTCNGAPLPELCAAAQQRINFVASCGVTAAPEAGNSPPPGTAPPWASQVLSPTPLE